MVIYKAILKHQPTIKILHFMGLVLRKYVIFYTTVVVLISSIAGVLLSVKLFSDNIGKF